MREIVWKEITLQADLCRTFKEGGRSGLDLLEKDSWILLLDKQ